MIAAMSVCCYVCPHFMKGCCKGPVSPWSLVEQNIHLKTSVNLLLNLSVIPLCNLLEYVGCLVYLSLPDKPTHRFIHNAANENYKCLDKVRYSLCLVQLQGGDKDHGTLCKYDLVKYPPVAYGLQDIRLCNAA